MRLPWLKVQQNAFSRAKELAALLGVELDTALGKVLLLWQWSIDRVRDEDVPDGIILGPQAHKLIASVCLWQGDALEFVEALMAAGFIERIDVTRDGARTSERPPRTEGLRIRGMSVYAQAITKRIGDAERKRRERELEKAALEARKRKRTSVTRDIQRTSRGGHADILETALPRRSPPSVGRSVVSEPVSFSKTDRPSVEPAQSLSTRGTPPVPLATATATPAPKRSVDVGKRRREKRLAARTSKSSYAVTVEAEPFEAELDELLAAEADAKGIPPPRLWADRGDAFEALRRLRGRFAAVVVLRAFTAFLASPGVRDRRLIIFLQAPKCHGPRCEKAEVELAAEPKPLECVACGGRFSQARQLYGLEFVDACGHCFDRFLEHVGPDVADARDAVEAWGAWLAECA